MTSADYAELKTQLDRIEGLVARLIDLQLGAPPGGGGRFDPAELARDVLVRGAAAMKDHNLKRKRRQS